MTNLSSQSESATSLVTVVDMIVRESSSYKYLQPIMVMDVTVLFQEIKLLIQVIINRHVPLENCLFIPLITVLSVILVIDTVVFQQMRLKSGHVTFCEIHLPYMFYRLSAQVELFVTAVCSAPHAFVLQTLLKVLNKSIYFT